MSGRSPWWCWGPWLWSSGIYWWLLYGKGTILPLVEFWHFKEHAQNLVFAVDWVVSKKPLCAVLAINDGPLIAPLSNSLCNFLLKFRGGIIVGPSGATTENPVGVAVHFLSNRLLIIFAEVIDEHIKFSFDFILPVLHQFKLYMNLPLLSNITHIQINQTYYLNSVSIKSLYWRLFIHLLA